MIKKEKLAGYLDDVLDFTELIPGWTGKTLELGDNFLFKGALTIAENKIPEQWHDEINMLIDAVVDKDLSKIDGSKLGDIFAAIKTPLGDSKEAIIARHLLAAAVELMESDVDEMVLATTVGGGGHGTDPDNDPEHDGSGG